MPMVRPIVKYGAEVLRQPALPIEEVTGEVAALARDMVETMYRGTGRRAGRAPGRRPASASSWWTSRSDTTRGA